jgi:hypothetical protein
MGRTQPAQIAAGRQFAVRRGPIGSGYISFQLRRIWPCAKSYLRGPSLVTIFAFGGDPNGECIPLSHQIRWVPDAQAICLII